MNHNYYPKTHRRIPELDLLKTVAVIGMIFVHVLECSENLNTVGTLRRAIATFIEFFGCAPSACIFMFAMGWGAALSRESSVKHSIDRFGQLCILGLLVNFFQQIVPMIINPEVFGSPIENSIPSSQLIFTNLPRLPCCTLLPCRHLAKTQKLDN